MFRTAVIRLALSSVDEVRRSRHSGQYLENHVIAICRTHVELHDEQATSLATCSAQRRHQAWFPHPLRYCQSEQSSSTNYRSESRASKTSPSRAWQSTSVSSTMREADDQAFDCLLLHSGSAAGEESLHRSTCASVKMEGGISGQLQHWLMRPTLSRNTLSRRTSRHEWGASHEV